MVIRCLYKTRLFILLFILVLYAVSSYSNLVEAPMEQIKSEDKAFQLGLENIPESFLKTTARARVGLITNQTGVSQDKQSNIALLLKKKVNVTKIFTPEHGLNGMIHTDAVISHKIDASSGLTVIPLFSQGRMIQINYDMAKDIDILMFDIQDSGMRYYTYITTLFQAMNSAAKLGKKFVVLDRPNPLGPCVNGPLVSPMFKSAISIAPIPLRHGMTVAELALYFKAYVFPDELKKKLDLTIIPMKDYKRDSYEQNVLLTYLSSGIRNINACYCYSFLGPLGELRPFHIGLGTRRRFQCIMLPNRSSLSMRKWADLIRLLRRFGVQARFFTAQKNQKKLVGVDLQVADMYKLDTYKLLLTLILFFKHHGISIDFSNKMFDLAMGTDKVRLFLTGILPKSELEAAVNKNLSAFYQRACNAHCFLYKPYPRVQYLDLEGLPGKQ